MSASKTDKTANPKAGVMGWLSGAWKNTPANLSGRTAVERGAVLRASLETFRAVYGKKTYLKETFEEAVERKELEQSDLDAQRGALIISSRMAYAFAALIFATCVYYTLFGSIFSVISAGAACCFCVVGGWLRAYRAWQIEIRRFGHLREFMGKPESWIV